MQHNRKLYFVRKLCIRLKIKFFYSSAEDVQEEKNRQSLLTIVGKDSLSFFNFLINSKSLLVSTIGQFAGIPPTILAPTAFRGACLRSLKVCH